MNTRIQQRGRRRGRRNRRRGRNGGRGKYGVNPPQEAVPKWILQQSIQGEPYYNFVEYGNVVLRTNTVTSGVLAVSDTFGTSDLTNFSTRYGTAFSEYLIYRVDYIVTPIAPSSGYSKFWFSHNPTQNVDLVSSEVASPCKTVYHTNANDRNYVISFYISEYAGLVWSPTIGTWLGGVDGLWAIYTNAANYGAPIVATPLYTTQFKIHVLMRGRTNG